MTWALRELWWVMLIALLVGLVPLGWLLWRWRCTVVDPAAFAGLAEGRRELEDRLAESERERDALHRELAAAAVAESELARHRDALATREAERSSLTARLRDAEQAAAGASHVAASVPAELAARDARIAELEPLRALLDERTREAVELRADAEAATRRVADVEARLGEMTRNLIHAERGLAAAEARLAELEPAPSLDPPPDVSERIDDLEEIRGIGPVLVRLLHRDGIRSFWELARLDENGVEALDAKLEDFRGRIRRERWVEQARQLHEAKYGERIES